ncbi:MAG: hypothetical protein AB7S38_00820 [Vulcanimicrobiota bacterium]
MNLERIGLNDPSAYTRGSEHKAQSTTDNKDAEAASAANGVAPVAPQAPPANQLPTDQIVTGPQEASGASGADGLIKGLQQNYGPNAGQDPATRPAAAA